MNKKKIALLGLGMLLSIFMVACQPTEPKIVVKTVIVEKEGQTVIETIVVTVEPTP